jgi:hypothetical protein
MDLFSFRHSVPTFSDRRKADARQAMQGQTEAHLRYITRNAAARVVIRERIAHASLAAIGRQAEAVAQKRKGRVCERFIVALPVEATAAQREALTRAFGEAITGGKAGFVAAIHDKASNDIANPHFHLVAFDAHEKTGGRGRPRSLIGMARKGAVERAAKEWADLHNRMMREWGYGEASMISHRSNADRGIDRVPMIHEGPGGRAMARLGKTPTTKAEWRAVDDGRTRAQANRVIRQIIKRRTQPMNAQIDWEDMMTKAERSATAASMNAERAVGGVAEMLAEQRRHSRALRQMREDITKLSSQIDRPSPPASPEQAVGLPLRIVLPRLGVAIAVAAVCGASIASW